MSLKMMGQTPEAKFINMFYKTIYVTQAKTSQQNDNIVNLGLI